MSELQLLLMHLLEEQMLPDIQKQKRRLTYNILYHMMGMEREDEMKIFIPDKTYVEDEDEYFYYVSFMTTTDKKVVIPVSKRWGFTNQIKNHKNLFEHEKQNQQKSSSNHIPK